MKTKMSLHSDKCNNSYFGEEELGLTGKALENFKYALYEVRFDVDVNEETGAVKIEKVDDTLLITPEIQAELKRLCEVEKDGADLLGIVRKQRSDIRKLNNIIEEMFKICPCICNTDLDYECAKCEAKRIIKEIHDGG